MDSKNIDQLLSRYCSLHYNQEKTKIICKWSGHELPIKVDSVLTYVNGNKYKKLLEKNINQIELQKYMEFLVPSNKPKRENQFFCKLTLRHLNKQPDHVIQHVNGKRFQKAYKHWLYCQETNQEYVPFSKQNIKQTDTNEIEEDAGSEGMMEEMIDLIDGEVEMNHNESKIKEMKIKADDAIDEDEEDEMETNTNKRKHDAKINKKKIEPKKKKQFQL